MPVSLQDYLAVVRKDRPAELVLKDVRIVNVHSAEIIASDLALHQGKIIGWGNYQGETELNLNGSYVLPGLIDAHFHFESSMILPAEFCRTALTHGTTTVAADPHELANVSGILGIEFIREHCGNLPLNILLQLPSCVPATSKELSGARLLAKDLEPLIHLPGVHGLGEMMNFYGVVAGDLEVLEKLEIMGDRFIDGHAPLLKAEALNAYRFAGVLADHECTDIEDAKEKIRRGMYVMVREGSAAKDLVKLIPLITQENSRRFVFCTDDRHPTDLSEEGHIDFVIQKAIRNGMDPIEAIRMATLNAAECLRCKDIGAIAPGMRGDLVVVNDLDEFTVTHVFKDGELVVDDGVLLKEVSYTPEIRLRDTIHVGEICAIDLKIPLSQKYRVIQVQPDQLLTKELVKPVEIDQVTGSVLEPDVAKVVVVDRYQNRGQLGVGLIQGFGLESGAIGSSVAHDSHNIIIVGRDDQSILAVLEQIVHEQGGLAIALEGRIQEVLPLPIAGLLSDQPISWVADKLNRLHQQAKVQGVRLSDPFMTLSFMSLPVIPELKMTSQGLFDVRQNRLVSVACEDLSE